MSNLMVHTERFTRSRDPETSWDAAAIIGAAKWTAVMRSVYHIVAIHGPMTRDQIFATYVATRIELNLPYVTPQRVRTAVKSLLLGERVDFGHVQKCTRALRVADMDGRSDAGNRAERLEVTR